MKFSEFVYQRPNVDQLEEKLRNLIESFKKANSFEQARDILNQINQLRNDFSTASAIATIRYCMNTLDDFYKKEKEYFDEASPRMEGVIVELYKALVSSPFKDQLQKEFGNQLFTIAQLQTKTFKPEVLEDLILENKLGTEYSNLVSSAKIPFEGQNLTLPQVAAFMQVADRQVRKKAAEAYFSFFERNEEKTDKIYDQLVEVRTKIAHKLGYENFVQLAYDRLGRSDYNPKMVAKFREAIKKYIVPVVSELREEQRKRLEVDVLKYYDFSVVLKEGNPKPKGEPDEIIQKARQMYEEMSPETGEFFNFMLEDELMDLKSREGKYPGGFCHFIPNYKSPFIFANFNGTQDDVEVLTHEAGHAFQVYRSRNFTVPEYYWPTTESCEIHSMSMEFFAWPWLELFYGQDAEKAKFVHLSSALFFIPYGTLVDEFQHLVYENPSMTPQQRKKLWRSLEKIYMPELDYDGNKFLENGGRWHRQTHIFESPFYYIDYVLAQICAFQFWIKWEENRKKAFEDYLKLCDAGGSKSFMELVKLANLSSPFEEETIKKVAEKVVLWLEKQKI
ncbi:oligoendopeptidase, M3 family [Pseudothermotoga thermarum DSM 5069]|uniref:Oligoendopeptidase, M3 family n=1 Tax=Pseudothermotoga thermarum DSM 5069 TaxID=688269 RepID=F7YTP4_9THEM|nr:M3 family oligoendopeptidase [Pseudothermotoga thermarum]AEH51266.1 oligoendopeptidase, M3 family [Pseudothermotoga thermarum DSM 5069]